MLKWHLKIKARCNKWLQMYEDYFYQMFYLHIFLSSNDSFPCSKVYIYIKILHNIILVNYIDI